MSTREASTARGDRRLRVLGVALFVAMVLGVALRAFLNVANGGARSDLETGTAFDVILLRQDPPFDLNYITTTHLLERIHPKTLVVNDPAHVRNAPEKIFVTEFVDLMPPL